MPAEGRRRRESTRGEEDRYRSGSNRIEFKYYDYGSEDDIEERRKSRHSDRRSSRKEDPDRRRSKSRDHKKKNNGDDSSTGATTSKRRPSSSVESRDRPVSKPTAAAAATTVPKPPTPSSTTTSTSVDQLRQKLEEAAATSRAAVSSATPSPQRTSFHRSSATPPPTTGSSSAPSSQLVGQLRRKLEAARAAFAAPQVSASSPTPKVASNLEGTPSHLSVGQLRRQMEAKAPASTSAEPIGPPTPVRKTADAPWTLPSSAADRVESGSSCIEQLRQQLESNAAEDKAVDDAVMDIITTATDNAIMDIFKPTNNIPLETSTGSTTIPSNSNLPHRQSVVEIRKRLEEQAALSHRNLMGGGERERERDYGRSRNTSERNHSSRNLPRSESLRENNNGRRSSRLDADDTHERKESRDMHRSESRRDHRDRRRDHHGRDEDRRSDHHDRDEDQRRVHHDRDEDRRRDHHGRNRHSRWLSTAITKNSKLGKKKSRRGDSSFIAQTLTTSATMSTVDMQVAEQMAMNKQKEKDKKKRKRKRREKFSPCRGPIMCLIVCFVLLGVLGLGVWLWVRMRNPSIGRSWGPTVSPSETPSAAPTTQSSWIGSIIFEVARFGGEEFNFPDTYQRKAMEWILVQGNNIVDSANDDMPFEDLVVQLYALACLYYSSFQMPNDITTVLLESENVGPWTNSDRWMVTGVNGGCDWYGVVCNRRGQVEKLSLPSNQLSGNIPPEISLLKDSITYMDLYNNDVHNVGGLGNSFLGEMSNLRYLYLGQTFFEHDGIPAELSRLSNLIELDISFTSWFGPLNSSPWSRLTNLEYLVMNGNVFNTTLPEDLVRLPKLQYLYVVDSFLKGGLDWVSRMPAIRELWIDNNPLLSEIPESLSYSSTLASFSAGNCGLKGTIPASLANLDGMTHLWLNDNSLGSGIPGELSRLSNLQTLSLMGNSFDGGVPNEICSQKDLTGRLQTVEVDSSIPCECCTCCDR